MPKLRNRKAMPYALEPLLKIRATREDRAAGALAAAKRKTAKAAADLEARREELENFERTKDERRDRIYETIIGRTVKRDNIDLANEGIAKIDEEGAMRIDGVKRAEKDLDDRKREEEAARLDFVLSAKNRMKIDEHKARHTAEEALDAEKKAEGELEDFVARKPEI